MMQWVSAIAGWAGLFFFFLIMALAIASIVIGLPGCWIIVGEAIIFALITKFNQGIGWWDLAALTAMAGAAELFEFIITAYGAKKYGASNRAVFAALVGGLIGAVLVNMVLWVVGALIGAFLGVFLGAFIYTYLTEKDLAVARRAGIGAFMGRMGAVLTKGAIAVAMAAVIITQVLPFL
jgi:uncharacterized protein YqgC (DUF456 family)